MLKNASNKTKKKFLRKFTKHLINSKKEQMIASIRNIEEKQRIKRAIEVDKLKTKYIKPKLVPKPRSKPRPKPTPKSKIKSKTRTKIKSKKIPTPPQELKQKPRKPVNLPDRPKPPMRPVPLAAPSASLELGKLNALIRDPLITSIECQGENKPLIITKNNQTSKSEIKLNKQEISVVITEFSEKARIPLIEGLLRARVGNLEISAVVSKIASSRFIITKTFIQPLMNLQQQQPRPVAYPGLQRSIMQPGPRGPITPPGQPRMPGMPLTRPRPLK